MTTIFHSVKRLMQNLPEQITPTFVTAVDIEMSVYHKIVLKSHWLCTYLRLKSNHHTCCSASTLHVDSKLIHTSDDPVEIIFISICLGDAELMSRGAASSRCDWAVLQTCLSTTHGTHSHRTGFYHCRVCTLCEYCKDKCSSPLCIF